MSQKLLLLHTPRVHIMLLKKKSKIKGKGVRSSQADILSKSELCSYGIDPTYFISLECKPQRLRWILFLPEAVYLVNAVAR
ncbi:unnamed protein product [Allacma fusca]|uniref:Uncharacterized protein n=1 Tax=Allacma fusca TaxID=39272 RepID=A0A8J2NV10_9HEXA|nr:unnamed protein product [Allacma fusca]